MTESCRSCRYFNGESLCERWSMPTTSGDEVCSEFKKKGEPLPDVYIPDEEDFPEATDEGYDVATT